MRKPIYIHKGKLEGIYQVANKAASEWEDYECFEFFFFLSF